MIICEFNSPLDLVDKATHYRSGEKERPVSEIVSRERCPRCGRTATIKTATGVNASFTRSHMDCAKEILADPTARPSTGSLDFTFYPGMHDPSGRGSGFMKMATLPNGAEMPAAEFEQCVAEAMHHIGQERVERYLQEAARRCGWPIPAKYRLIVATELAMLCQPVYTIKSGNREVRLTVWDGQQDYAGLMPAGVIAVVGGNRIAVVQINSPTGGVGGRSSLKLSEMLGKDKKGFRFDGIVHWARDTATYRSIITEFEARNLARAEPRLAPDRWRPEVVVSPYGGEAEKRIADEWIERLHEAMRLRKSAGFRPRIMTTEPRIYEDVPDPPKATIALRFINAAGALLVWGPLTPTPEEIARLRDVPVNASTAPFEPGETFVDYVERSVHMVVDYHRRAHEGLTAIARGHLIAHFLWYVIWQKGDVELQRRAGYDSFYVDFRRDPGGQHIDIKVFWGEYKMPAGAELLHDQPLIPTGTPELAKTQSKSRTFAPLAGAALRYLEDPSPREVLPPQLVQALLAEKTIPGWNKKTKRRYFEAPFEQVRQRLRQARKMVFADDFQALVRAAGERSPEELVRLFATARMPFEECWLEWTDVDGSRIGMLIAEQDGVHGTMIVHQEKADNELTILPFALRFSLQPNEPGTWRKYGGYHGLSVVMPERDDDWHDHALMMFGKEYCEHWEADSRQLMILERLGEYCWVVIGGAPLGRLAADFLFKHGRAVDRYPALKAYYSETMPFVGMMWRAVITPGLALLATHRGGGPVVATKVTTPPRYYHGRFHPAYEYEVLRLERPMGAPTFLKYLRKRRKSGDPLRSHEVIACWHHERTPTERTADHLGCDEHPRACPIALWRRREPSDIPIDEPAGPKDQQYCALCQRKRWHVKSHWRGDARFGVVDKDYEITAPRRP